MSKKRTKRRKPKKYKVNLSNRINESEQVTKIIINDYSYFPPPRKDDLVPGFQKKDLEKMQQVIKEHNLDINKSADVIKMHELLDAEIEEVNTKQKLDLELEESPVAKIFSCWKPYFSLEQLVGHYYLADTFNQTNKANPHEKQLELDFLILGIKSLVKSWNELIPEAEKLVVDFLQQRIFSNRESAFWAGLMRDKPLLPILGSLMDLWFYPRLGHVKSLDLADEDFLSLIKKAWKIEKTFAQELLNQDPQTIINGLIKVKSKSTYHWIQFNSSETHFEILGQNFEKVKNDPLGKEIFNFLNQHIGFPPRLLLSFKRFGIKGEKIVNFVNNLSVNAQSKAINLKRDPQIIYLLDLLKKLKTLLTKHQSQIKDVIINKKSPCYDILTYLLECFTIRPTLQGMVYWNRIAKVPHFEKLFALALEVEISYLKTLTSLPLESFASWFVTTKYAS